MDGQTHPTFHPTSVFSMLDETLDAFERGFKIRPRSHDAGVICVSAWADAHMSFATKRPANWINYLLHHRSGALLCVTTFLMHYESDTYFAGRF